MLSRDIRLCDLPPHPVYDPGLPYVPTIADKKVVLINAVYAIADPQLTYPRVWSTATRRKMDEYQKKLTSRLFWKESPVKPWDYLAVAAEPYMWKDIIQSVQELLELAEQKR